MFQYGIDAASARAFVQRNLQLREQFSLARGDYFDMSLVGVLHPAAQTKFSGFAVDEPAKTDSLNAAFDEVMTDHDYLLNPIYIGIQNKAVAYHLSAETHTRNILGFAENTAQVTYEWIFGRQY